jgi:hypothetical protein
MDWGNGTPALEDAPAKVTLPSFGRIVATVVGVMVLVGFFGGLANAFYVEKKVFEAAQAAYKEAERQRDKDMAATRSDVRSLGDKMDGVTRESGFIRADIAELANSVSARRSR